MDNKKNDHDKECTCSACLAKKDANNPKQQPKQETPSKGSSQEQHKDQNGGHTKKPGCCG